MSTAVLSVVPTLILIAGTIDDLRSRKIHNKLVVICFIAAIAFKLLTGGSYGLFEGLGGAFTALAAFLPLVLIGAVGAGDMKLMAAFGMATSFSDVLYVGLYSLAWGVLLGLLRILFSGKIKAFAQNLKMIASREAVPKENLNTMPYSVALFCGWITHLTSVQIGGLI